MTLHLVITTEALEAALYETGPLLPYSKKNGASLALSGPRLVVKDYHDMIAAVTELEARLSKKESLTGILAEIGPVSFTRHRQTIALVNSFAALRNIPALALEYTEEKPTEAVVAKTILKLAKTPPAKPLVPHYRAEPTITLRQAQGKPKK